MHFEMHLAMHSLDDRTNHKSTTGKKFHHILFIGVSRPPEATVKRWPSLFSLPNLKFFRLEPGHFRTTPREKNNHILYLFVVFFIS